MKEYVVYAQQKTGNKNMPYSSNNNQIIHLKHRILMHANNHYFICNISLCAPNHQDKRSSCCYTNANNSGVSQKAN